MNTITNVNEAIQEYVDSRGVSVRVDPAAGVIRGIKILGLRSRNGREYLPEALQSAVSLYEGAKVNVNHPKGHPTGPRDYQERIGVIRHVVARAEQGLYGDLYYNPKHALAEQLAWDAQHAPENVGLSHNVEARTSRRGETVVVEAITRVQSVDLVADPATTRGLFEQRQPKPAAIQPVEQSPTRIEETQSPDLWQALCQEQAGEIERLRRELAGIKSNQLQVQRQITARRLLAEFHLPDPDATDSASRALLGRNFLESLLAAEDEAAMRRMVEERAALLNHARRWDRQSPAAGPQSRDQSWADESLDSTMDAERFARSIR